VLAYKYLYISRDTNGSNFALPFQTLNPNYSINYKHQNLVEYQNLFFNILFLIFQI
jgi:hypothetical protein